MTIRAGVGLLRYSRRIGYPLPMDSSRAAMSLTRLREHAGPSRLPATVRCWRTFPKSVACNVKGSIACRLTDEREGVVHR